MEKKKVDENKITDWFQTEKEGIEGATLGF